MVVNILEVKSKSELRRFIKFSWKVYEGDSNWVPPLIVDLKTKLNPQKNPFFEHSRARLFIAEKDGRIAGRIAAVINGNHNRTHNETTGFFGFFECIRDSETAAKLFDTAADYLRAEGMTVMRGPANFSSNDDWGLLVDGFDKPPVVMMPYNPSYYIDLMEDYGFRKAMDLFAFWMEHRQMTERMMRAAEAMKRRTKINIRTLNMKDFDNEVKRIRKIYNEAWIKNWGFVPMTENEFNHTARDFKLILDPDLALIAEYEGEPVGFSLAIPDINQALIHINGRLLPFGIFKLLHYKKKINAVRVPIMGVTPEFRNRGIDLVFYYETFKNVTSKGYRAGEFSWMLEINEAMNRQAENMGAKVYKTYRLYDYPLT